MCPGTATKLLCSHYLVHWSGPRCPKKCVLPAQRVFLPCTCAPCDPTYRQTQIRARYTAEREKLLARIRDAALQQQQDEEQVATVVMGGGGAGGEVRLLERRLHTLLIAQMVELGAARRFLGGGGGVGAAGARLDPAVGCRWPGMYEQWVAENLGREVDWDALLNG